MATATHEAPWSEAQIREAIAGRIRENLGNLMDVVDDALDPVVDSDQASVRRGWVEGFYPGDDHPGTLWADLTAEESEDLRSSIDAAIDRDELAAIVTDRVVVAAAAFGRRHPGLPRGAYRGPRPAVARHPTSARDGNVIGLMAWLDQAVEREKGRRG